MKVIKIELNDRQLNQIKRIQQDNQKDAFQAKVSHLECNSRYYKTDRKEVLVRNDQLSYGMSDQLKRAGVIK